MAELLRHITRPVLGIDLDDTKSKTAEKFIDVINTEFGSQLEVGEWDEDVQRLLGSIGVRLNSAQYEDFLQLLFDQQRSGQLEPIEGSIEELGALSEYMDLYTITSRRSERAMMDATMDWDRTYFPFMKGIEFAGIYAKGVTQDAYGRTKGPVYERLGANGAIDDMGKHLKAAASLGMHAVSLERHSYAKKQELPPSIIRVSTWAEARQFMMTALPKAA